MRMKYGKGNNGFGRQLLASAALAAVCVPGAVHAGPTVWHGDEAFLTVNYELQMWAQYRDFRSEANDGDAYDFFLRRNRVTFLGQYNDYVGFYAQLEAGNDSKGGQDDRSVFYRDAYITFDWSDSVRVIAGRFKNTFSRENLEVCLEPLTLDRGLQSYTPFAGTRDTGVALWGNVGDGAFQYRLMLADGRESDAVPKDSPRMTARVHYSFFEPEYFYGYRGTYLGTRRVLTLGAAVDHQSDVAYSNFPGRQDMQDYNAWTVDLFYEEPLDIGTVTLSGAYFNYDVGGATNVDPLLRDATLVPNADSTGYYVKGGYLFPRPVGPGRLQVFARHDRADFEREFFDYRINAAGFNYYLDGQRLKFTFEYADQRFDDQHPTVRALQDYKQATLGFQLLF